MENRHPKGLPREQIHERKERIQANNLVKRMTRRH